MGSALVQEIISEKKITDKSGLLMLLQILQERTGVIQYHDIVDISKQLGIAESKIFGIASFYNYFRFIPKGKFHIEICTGTSCYLCDCEKMTAELTRLTGLSNGELSRDGLVSIEHTGCLGGCSQGPVLKINDSFFTHVDVAKLRNLVSKLQSGEMPEEMSV
ncbi:MAG TPA: NAD(P)H-dependent oxidoreductase subunit E [Bacteroidales bacterium]|nr:NAD(P)H-dependent oxidoreductase subunit E [Bacteroidales bacterium]HQL70346.1 NAD(P)H-dependent oxidoreductase subunit E [Bacteroidales bacterium]